MSRDWTPAVYDHEASRITVTRIVNGQPVERVRDRTVPNVGELIAWIDRKAYRVVEVHDREQANWHDATTKAWERAGRPDPRTWPDRERSIHLRATENPAGRIRARGLYPWASNRHWWPLPDPYPACVACGLLWPCPCHDRNQEARKAMAEFERLAAILPGCCWNCGNPVEKRQHSIVFDGDNLLMPGAGPVVFHTSGSRFYETRLGKRGCRRAAVEYEQRWTEAAPGRAARLSCPGVLWRHYEHSECTTGDVCPGDQADHSEYVHCTVGYGRCTSDGGAVELRPDTNCGGRGCRGQKAPAEPASCEEVR